MMDNNLAPLILFTYNRLDTLELVVENLQKNTLASETELFIFSDFSKKEKDVDSVEKVRVFLDQIIGFKSVTIIKREKNYGLGKNIIEGVTDIINKYGKVIVLEDDLLTSENFLSYMNESLEFYKEDKKIFAISGFCWDLPSLKTIEEDVFLSYRPASWGWATWKDQWINIDWDITDYEAFIKDKKAIQKFNRGGMDMTRMLKDFKLGKNNSWAIRWSYSMSKQNKYCIYPKLSKVQNIGFGENATHCTGEHIHTTVIDKSNNINFKFSENLVLNEKILKEFKYQNSYLNKAIKKTFLKLENILKAK